MTDTDTKLSQAGYPIRERADFFTPHWVTNDCLLPHISPAKHILEPAVGNGGIKHVFEAYGHDVTGLDIHPDPAVDQLISFLDYTNPDNIPFDIISNPPYFKPHDIDVKFIKHALALTKPHNGLVAMLLPVAYDCGKTRREIFEDEPSYKHKITITERISWTNMAIKINKDGKAVGPTKNHAWYIWQHGNNGASTNLFAPVKNARQNRELTSYAENKQYREQQAAKMFSELAVV